MSGFIERMEATGGPAEFHHVDVHEYEEALLGMAREHIEEFGNRIEKDMLKKPKVLRDYVYREVGNPIVPALAHNAAHDKLEEAKSQLSQEEKKLEKMRLSDNLFTKAVVPAQAEHADMLITMVAGAKTEVARSNHGLLSTFQEEHNLG